MNTQNPWLSIWTEPRATIHRIVSVNPNRCCWFLAAVYGFSSLLNSFQSIALGNQMNLAWVLGLAVIFSSVWGYVVFSIWSWVVYLVGKIFRGKGTYVQIRAAYAWSCVPLVVNCLLWIVLIFSFGSTLFSNVIPDQLLSNGQSLFIFLVLIAKVILAIWALVIYLNALSEVQQYSILKTIGNVLASGVLIGLVLGLIWNASIQFVGVAMETSQTTYQLIQSWGGL